MIALLVLYLAGAAVIFRGGRYDLYPIARVLVAVLWPAVVIGCVLVRGAERVGLG